MKIFKSDANDIYDMIKPLYYSAKICGFWAHTIKKQKKGNLSPLNFLYFCFMISIYIFLIIKNYNNEFWILYANATNSTILTYGQYLQIEGGLIIGLILCVLHFIHIEKKWKILEVFNEIDYYLEKKFFVIIPKNFLRGSIFSIFVIANVGLLLVMLILLMFFQILMQMSNYIVYFSNYLANLAYFSLFSQYFCCNLFIRRRFIYINSLIKQCILDNPLDELTFIKPADTNEELLLINFEEIYTIYGRQNTGKNFEKSKVNARKVIKEIQSTVEKLKKPELSPLDKVRFAAKQQLINLRITKQSTNEEIIEALSELGRMHDLLSYSIKLMNETHSFQLLIITAAIFIFILFGLFSGYRILSNNIEIQRYIGLAYLTLDILYMIVLVLMLLINSSVIKSCKSTALVVHHVMRRIDNKKILEKLNSMSQQFLIYDQQFTCGLFPFDWTLLYSTIASGTTYLIILIQFDLGFK